MTERWAFQQYIPIFIFIKPLNIWHKLILNPFISHCFQHALLQLTSTIISLTLISFFTRQTHGIALHVSCLTQLDYTLIFMAPKKVYPFSIHSLLGDRAFKQIMSPGFSFFMTPVNRLPYWEPCPGGFWSKETVWPFTRRAKRWPCPGGSASKNAWA